MKRKIISIIAFLVTVAGLSATISVTSLRTEGLTNPLGLDMTNPRLSWKAEATSEKDVIQKAYQILVASSIEKLNTDNGDVWNSGKISSDVSLWIPFAGKTLLTNFPYFWKVRVWTNKGETGWSAAANWSMGLLSENDWKAQWIG